MQKDGTTGALSPLPFVSLLANCTVWSLYGALVGDPTVLVPNLSGALFGAYYTREFLKYSPTTPLAVLAAGAGVVAASVGAAATMSAASAAPLIGYLGCTLAVVLMASPLAVMATVIRERSTAAMPFATSLVRSPLTLNSRWLASMFGSFIASRHRGAKILAPELEPSPSERKWRC